MDKKSMKIKGAVGLLKQLSHPVRLSILCNLLQRGEMSVGEIVAAEDGAVTQPQISQFLGKMKSEGLLENRKEAQTVYYKIASPRAEQVVKSLYGIYCEK